MAIKTKTRAEKHHLAKVAALGCIACRKIGYQDTPAEIHHRHGPNAIHRSKDNFEADFGTERELLEIVLSEVAA